MESVDDLLQRHLPALHAYVRLRAGPVVAARESLADLVQSTCREVLEGRERFEYQGEAAFKTWLFATALHKILEKHRYHRAEKRDVAREVVPALDADSSRSVLDCYATFTTPSQHLAVSERMAAIEAAYARLSEPHREVITLAKVVGLSHEEVASKLGITAEASRQLLRRALLRLATLLESSDCDGSI